MAFPFEPTISQLTISGGVYGLSGALLVIGPQGPFRVMRGFSSGLSWSAISVALLAQGRETAILPAALFIAFLKAGSDHVMIGSGVPSEIISMLQAAAMLFITAQVMPNWQAAKTIMNFSPIVLIDFLKYTIAAATPLLFASIGGLFSELSGMLNIALEGLMAIGAFFGMAAAGLTSNIFWSSCSDLSALACFNVDGLNDQQVSNKSIYYRLAINLLAQGITADFVSILVPHKSGRGG